MCVCAGSVRPHVSLHAHVLFFSASAVVKFERNPVRRTNRGGGGRVRCFFFLRGGEGHVLGGKIVKTRVRPVSNDDDDGGRPRRGPTKAHCCSRMTTTTTSDGHWRRRDRLYARRGGTYRRSDGLGRGATTTPLGQESPYTDIVCPCAVA